MAPWAIWEREARVEGGQAVLLNALARLMRTGSIRCGGGVVQYLPLRHPCMVYGIYVPYIPRPRNGFGIAKCGVRDCGSTP